MKAADFEKAKTVYNTAVSDWGKAFNKVKLQGECVVYDHRSVPQGREGLQEHLSVRES